MHLKRMLAAVLLLLLVQVSGSSQAQRLGVKKTFYTGYGVNRVEYVSDVEPHPDGGWVILDRNHGLISRYSATGKYLGICGNAEDLPGASYPPSIQRILVDRQGFVYAFGERGGAKFNPDGTLVTLFDDLPNGATV